MKSGPVDHSNSSSRFVTVTVPEFPALVVICASSKISPQPSKRLKACHAMPMTIRTTQMAPTFAFFCGG